MNSNEILIKFLDEQPEHFASVANELQAISNQLFLHWAATDTTAAGLERQFVVEYYTRLNQFFDDLKTMEAK